MQSNESTFPFIPFLLLHFLCTSQVFINTLGTSESVTDLRLLLQLYKFYPNCRHHIRPELWITGGTIGA